VPYEIEYRFWDRARSEYRWHLGRALPMRDETGRVVKWFGTCTDIHDFKKAQTEILALNQELEARVVERTRELSTANSELDRARTWLQSVLDSATQVSIIATDNSGTITLFNSGAEKLLGYRMAEMVNLQTPAIILSQEDRENRASQASQRLGRTISPDDVFATECQSDEATVSEAKYIRKDGKPVDVNLAVTPMVSANGERIGSLGIAIDITARKALERQLSQNNEQLLEQTRRAEEANRAKSDFLAAMSHEIRTPMNAILGMADLLWESELDGTQRQYVEVFRRAGANLLTLVNDILDLSKIESGFFELEHIDFDLEDLVDRTIQMIRPKTKTKGIGLLSRIAPGVPSMFVGDPTRLQQVLLNLLGNAVKFTERGEITLTIEANTDDPGHLHFHVSDTGIGIAEDKKITIFEDFTQAEASTTRRFGGTGLGLGICRRLINRMGGEIQVASEIGRGSTFGFDAYFQRSSQEKLKRAEVAPGLVGRQVLIVDNNPTNRLIFAEMCSAWGMLPTECASAGSALTALQAAAENGAAFDVAIIDRLMPGVDGFTLVARARELGVETPMLITSSDNVPGDETRGRQLGVAGYAVKPVRRSELLRLVCLALGAADGREQEEAARVTGQTAKVPALQQARILIAEDSEDNRFLLQEYLKGTPYSLTFVENSEAAVAMSRSEQFDLVLMDMQMPVKDGLSATREIRALEAAEQRRRIPILSLTANARTEDVQASQEAGCDSHVPKPISKAKLLATIEQYAGVPKTTQALNIDIPEGMEAAAKRYINSRRNEVTRLSQLADIQDFQQLRVLGHNMKGTGTSYGFPELTRLGTQIEEASLKADVHALSAALARLNTYVNAAVDAMAAWPQ
jgi:PAS domain S-box-containing protein